MVTHSTSYQSFECLLLLTSSVVTHSDEILVILVHTALEVHVVGETVQPEVLLLLVIMRGRHLVWSLLIGAGCVVRT
jgi:hypothetical protein